MGKRGRRRHSTTDDNENVEAETSYYILEVLSLCDQEKGA